MDMAASEWFYGFNPLVNMRNECETIVFGTHAYTTSKKHQRRIIIVAKVWEALK